MNLSVFRSHLLSALALGFLTFHVSTWAETPMGKDVEATAEKIQDAIDATEAKVDQGMTSKEITEQALAEEKYKNLEKQISKLQKKVEKAEVKQDTMAMIEGFSPEENKMIDAKRLNLAKKTEDKITQLETKWANKNQSMVEKYTNKLETKKAKALASKRASYEARDRKKLESDKEKIRVKKAKAQAKIQEKKASIERELKEVNDTLESGE